VSEEAVEIERDAPAEPSTGPGPVPGSTVDTAILDVPEQSAPTSGEIRRPTQRRRKRQSSGSTRR